MFALGWLTVAWEWLERTLGALGTSARVALLAKFRSANIAGANIPGFSSASRNVLEIQKAWFVI